MDSVKFRNALIALAIVVLSVSARAEDSSDELNQLLVSDYYSMSEKDQKSFEKKLKKTLKKLNLEELLAVDESRLIDKPLEIFQKELASKLKKSKRVDVLPVRDQQITISEVVSLENTSSQREIYESASKWVKDSNLFRKIIGKTSAFMVMGGQQVHSSMAQVEASMRSRSLTNNIRADDGKKIEFTLFQYIQTSGAADVIRTLTLESDVMIQFKDGRYRYQISGIKYDHYNHYYGNQSSFAMSSKCQVSGRLYQFQNVCESADGSRRNVLIKLRSDQKKFFADLKSGIEADLEQSEQDDW